MGAPMGGMMGGMMGAPMGGRMGAPMGGMMGAPMGGRMGGGMGGMAARPKKAKKKGKVKPKSKMKPLHWTKLNMKKSKGTVFEHLDEEACRSILFADGGEQYFVEAFGVPKKKKKEKKLKKDGDDGKKKKKKKKAGDMKTFIDGSKNQSVGISLKKYKIQPYRLKVQILCMDVKELPLDKVSGLLKCMPDEGDKKTR